MPETQQSKKYKLIATDWIERVDSNNKKHILHRIQAIKNFSDVKAGDYGGYIESESNLNQYDKSWVYSDAVRISKNAKIWGKARVFGNVKIYNSAEVCDYSVVCDDVSLYDDCKIHGKSKVYGYCTIGGITTIGGHAEINGNQVAMLGENKISDNVQITGQINIFGNVTLLGNTTIIGNSITLKGDILIREATNIGDNAFISSNDDFISVTNLGESHHIMTSYLTNQSVVRVHFGDWSGDAGTFKSMIMDKYPEENQHRKDILMLLDAAIQRFESSRGGVTLNE